MDQKETDKILSGLHSANDTAGGILTAGNSVIYWPHKIFPRDTYKDIYLNLNNSAAFLLVKAITGSITTECYIPSLYSDRFYSECLKKISRNSIMNYTDDKLMLVYLKQANNILRHADIINEPVSALNAFSMKLYLKLLNSFWNCTNWMEIFPSMPDLANTLQRNRKKIREIILMQKGRFRIDSLSNVILKSAGIRNNLLNISFLDFSILTWLGHFSIAKYIPGEDYSPVIMELTNYGRIILKYLIGEE